MSGPADPAGCETRKAAVRVRLAQIAGPDPEEDREFFRALWECFAERVPEELGALENALRRGAARDVEMVAHSLKGGAQNLGGTALADLLLALELDARTGRLQARTDAVAEVRREFDLLSRSFALVVDAEVSGGPRPGDAGCAQGNAAGLPAPRAERRP